MESEKVVTHKIQIDQLGNILNLISTNYGKYYLKKVNFNEEGELEVLTFDEKYNYLFRYTVEGELLEFTQLKKGRYDD